MTKTLIPEVLPALPNDIPPISTPYHKDIPIDRIIALKKAGYKNVQIADILKCDKSNISHRLNDIEGLDDFEKNEGSILAYHRREILNSISPCDYKRASLPTKAVTYGIFYDKGEKQRAIAPSAAKYIDYTKDISNVDDAIQALQDQIKG